MSDHTLHALLSPSGAAGWIVCSGKPFMEKGLPDNSNKDSEYGTAAHEVAKMCLTTTPFTDPAAYYHRRIDVGPHKTVEVDEEMVGGVRKYVQGVEAVIERYKLAGAVSVEAFIEQRVPIGHITGEEGAEGTADVVLIVLWPNGEALIHVIDLKFGVGVKVFAEENPQGMLYALGAVEKFSYATEFNRVVVSIHQPRVADEPSEWELPIEKLMLFAAHAKLRANVAMQAYLHENENSIHAHLKPGDHCRKTFCKARATCPKLAAFVVDSVGADFEVLSEGGQDWTGRKCSKCNGQGCPECGNTGDEHGSVVDVKPLPPSAIAQKFKAIDIIEDWCKAVRARAEGLLIEHHNSPEIIAELGIKLVQGKAGNRAWTSADEVEKLMKESMRLKSEEMYDMKIISPTTAEKRLKPKQWQRIQEFITRAEGKPSVAPASDRRPAMVIKPVVDDFSEVNPAEDLA